MLEVTETTIRQAHPWHGVNPRVSDGRWMVYVENAPLDAMKFEIDAETGLMKIDQPLQMTSLPPFAYGFVPRSVCGERVARLAGQRRGDRQALDVFVLTERPLTARGVLAEVTVIGGLPMQDDTYTDIKLISVLHRDAAVGHMSDISELPVHMIDRIAHFLSTNALIDPVVVGDPFDSARAAEFLEAAFDDYAERFPDLS